MSRNKCVFTSLHRNEFNLLSPMRGARLYMQVILSFFFFNFSFVQGHVGYIRRRFG